MDFCRGKLPFFVEPPAPPPKGFSYSKKDLTSAALRARQVFFFFFFFITLGLELSDTKVYEP